MLGDSSYEIRDESNQPILHLPTLAHNSKENASHVLDTIEHLAKFKLVKILTNKSLLDPAHSFEKSFSVRLVNSAGNLFHPGCCQAGWFSAGCSHSECLVEAEEDAKLQLIVQNRGGEGKHALYLHLYQMGPRWNIEDSFKGNHVIIPSCYKQPSFGLPTEWHRRMKEATEDNSVARNQGNGTTSMWWCYQNLSHHSVDLVHATEVVKIGWIGEAGWDHEK